MKQQKKIHRIYINSEFKSNNILCTTELSHRITNVLRMKNDEKLSVFNNIEEYEACLSIDGKKVSINLIEELPRVKCQNRVCIAVSVINMKLMDMIIQKSVELGVEYEASLEDWQTEYLDLILSIRIVDDLERAITHIQKYSSKHTDGIITENSNTANKFMNVVDSAGVFHNCSTRFADGFRYGFGAEVGISTQTLPPRGPVGLEGLVTYKYFLKGDGNIVDDFSSGKAIYTHKDL